VAAGRIGTARTLPGHFAGRSNIGVLLGDPSGWLVDIDLDHPRAVELADEYLPATDAIFGRPSKPRSHWLYIATSPVATKKHRSKSAGMIVELRSTGAQTVFPPSVHESGEPITWNQDDPQPTEIDPDELLEAVKKLAHAVKVELGEKATSRPKRAARQQPAAADDSAATQPPANQPTELPHIDARFKSALNAMLAMRMVDQSDGSSRLFAAACRCVEHDLPDEQAVECIRQYARQRPFPRTWSTDAIIQRLRDAEQRAQRGAAYQVDEEGLVPLGQRDPRSGRLVLSPRRTMPTAEAYLREFQEHPDRPTIVTYADLVMNWQGNRYVAIEDAAVKHELQPWLHEARRYIKLEDFELVPFESNPGTVKAALESIQQLTHLDATVTPPEWLIHIDKRPDPRELLPCQSCNLHVPTGKVYPATPARFTTNALGFDYDPNAPAPVRWLSFLNQLWPDDAQSIELLREWFGYCLTLDTSQQKMLLITGPKRSGKGTIGRVLSQLVGQANVCGPTTTSLAGTFGLQPLIGKSLAIVSDARFHGDNIAIVVERLLCVSGEDTLTIDRKHLPSVTMKLPTRFVFFTNELPRFTDSSGAIAGRFLTLRLTRSFFGQEDPQLTDKLLAELPGILLWALQGWVRLRGRGYFVQPDSVREAIAELEDLASPVGAFVRDCCVVGPGNCVEAGRLYEAWKQFCQSMGRDHPGTAQTFGRDLRAAVPGIATRQARDSGTRVRLIEGIALAPDVEWGCGHGLG